MRKLIRVGTRKSLLALAQTDIVKEKIEQVFPEMQVEIVKIDTRGDQIQICDDSSIFYLRTLLRSEFQKHPIFITPTLINE